MKIAALYDIHGNLAALDAVLAELEREQPDMIVVGGDIISGPMPAETLERLRQVGAQVHYIRGNGDREVVEAFDRLAGASEAADDAQQRVTDWVARQLNQEQRDFLALMPETFACHVEGMGDVLFCHATPASDEVIFTPLTPQERLVSLFSDTEQRFVVCGHTHVQFDLQAGAVRVLNAGSVGMPYADHPGAYWLWLGPEGSTFRYSDYDVHAAAQAVRASDYPQAQQFADENMLTIPSAQAAIEFFEPSLQQR